MKNVKFLICSLFLLLFFDSQGQTRAIFGSTVKGGIYGTGVVFRADANCTNQKVVYNFPLENEGKTANGELLEISNGIFLGVTLNGGKYDKGVLFQYEIASNTYTVKQEFGSGSNGESPNSGLMKALSGKIYGVTQAGGTNGYGILFEYDPNSNTLTKKADFLSTTTGNSYASTPVEVNGKLYGTRGAGGLSSGKGTIYEFDPANDNLVNKATFTGTSNGQTPYGHLFKAANGMLYGTTTYGGSSNSYGVIYEFNPTTGSLTKKITFNNTNGRWPQGSFVEVNSKLYGVTYVGGKDGDGVLFEYDYLANSIKTLYDFSDGNIYKPGLHSTLVVGGNGKLYGVNGHDGGSDKGGVYSYDITNKIYTDLDMFSALDGGKPLGSLIKTSDNKLLGLLSEDGLGASGTLYEFDVATNKAVKKIDFRSALNGAFPTGQFCLANKKIFGMTSLGGASNIGVIYEIDPLDNNKFTKRYDFEGTTGSTPLGGLTLGPDGKLYGMTSEGGTGYGVLFEFDPITGSVVKRFDFNGSVRGSKPRGSLTLAQNGKFYGMTQEGGTNDYGVVFQFDPINSIYTKKFNFDGPDGAYPIGDILETPDGMLYGMTYSGGNEAAGVLFSIDLVENSFDLIYSFDYMGYFPKGSLTLGTDGKIYGLTSTDKYTYKGKTFVYNRDTKKVFLSAFPPSIVSEDNDLATTMLQASNGKLYGMSMYGGTSAGGHIFYYDPVANSANTVINFSGINGFQPAENSRLFEVNITALMAGVSVISNKLEILTYPNPMLDILNLEFNEEEKDINVVVTNIMGMEVYTGNFNFGKHIEIGTSTWSSGVYFINVKTSKGSSISKVIKD